MPEGWTREPKVPGAPKGMLWIPAGALVAGTPPDTLPRKADSEMPGEQLMMEGFFVDQYAYPNEQGGLPLTNVAQNTARSLCEAEGKRLCSELEWERACKGPRNLVYEYGTHFVDKTCGMGTNSRPLPSGYLHGCRSEFGVADMHGGVWEWTDSPWGRGSVGDKVSLRGGNGADGEVIGRCANAEAKAPHSKAPDIGFRCCSGKRNSAEVMLEIEEGQALRLVPRISKDLREALESLLPDAEAREMKKRGLFRITRTWEWRPLANEDLLAAAGCAGSDRNRRCGALLLRRTLGRYDYLGWAPSGHFLPTMKVKFDPRVLFVYGGDRLGRYRRAVSFEWGKVAISQEQRNKDAP
jgi:formylglycine-generating enzyme